MSSGILQFSHSFFRSYLGECSTFDSALAGNQAQPINRENLSYLPVLYETLRMFDCSPIPGPGFTGVGDVTKVGIILREMIN